MILPFEGIVSLTVITMSQKNPNEEITEVQVITTKGVGVMSEKRWTGTPRLMNTAAARLANRLLLPPLGGWARAS